MKKILLSTLILASIFSINSQVLWDDFESNRNINYRFIDQSITVEANPLAGSSAINNSSTCGNYFKANAAGSPIVLAHYGNLFFEDITDFVSGAKKISMDLYYPFAGFPFDVRIKLQNGGLAFTGSGNDGVHSIYYASFSGGSDWEHLEFVIDGGYTPAPNTSVTNIDEIRLEIDYTYTGQDNYYIDNFYGPASFDPCSATTVNNLIFEDAECQRNIGYDFYNGGIGSVPNPLIAGVNTSSKSMKLVKSTETGFTDGAFGGSFSNSFTFTSLDYNKAKIQLYNPNGNVPGDTLIVVFRDASNTDLSYIKIAPSVNYKTQWEEHVIDFSSISPSIDIAKCVLLLNPHTTTKDEMYFDNFMLSNSLSVTENKKLEVSLTPNPTNNILNIESNSILNKVLIYDLTGKVVLEENVFGFSKTLMLSRLVEGSYIIKIEMKDGSAKTQKIVKY